MCHAGPCYCGRILKTLEEIRDGSVTRIKINTPAVDREVPTVSEIREREVDVQSPLGASSV